MAKSKLSGINIKIGADSTGLDTALKSIEKNTKSATSELKAIDSTIRKCGDSAELWTQKQEVLKTVFDECKQKLNLLESADEQLKKQLDNGEITAEQYRAFQRELANTRSQYDRLSDQISEADRHLNDFENSADDTADELEELEDATDSTSDGFTVFKDVLADLIADGIRLAVSGIKDFTQSVIETGTAFESSMSKVQAISQATESDIERISEKAQEMGETTKFTASESADAFSYMALAGWDASTMLAGIAPVLNLASASGIDLATASDIVTDYLTAFGLTANDTSHFVDMMSYAMANSNTDTLALAEAYKNCASTASSLGYSAEETTAVLMTMANAGVKGGEAGTGLSAIMTRLATDTKNCSTILASYGVNVYNSKGEMQSLSSILQGVSDVWSGLTDEEQANLAKTIAGTNHYSKLQTIMKGLSETAQENGKSFSDYADALQDCDGTAQKTAETMLDNLAGDMTILDSTIDGVKVSLSEELMPELRNLIQYVTKQIPEIQPLLEKMFTSGVNSVSWLVKHIPQLTTAVKTAVPVLLEVGTAILTWTAIEKVKETTKALFALISAHPLVAVTTALSALTAGIVTYIAARERELSLCEKVTEAHRKEYDELEDNRKKINELNNSFEESAKQTDSQADKAEYLWKQLQKLTDGYGNVTDANKIQAEYITGELSKALGEEIRLVDGQIQGYQNLSKEIDNIIAKKKAESYLENYLAMSSDMEQTKQTAREQYKVASAERDEAGAEMARLETAFKATLAGTDWAGFDANTVARSYGEVGGSTQEQYESALAYLEAQAKYADATSRLSIAKSEYNDTMQYFNNLDNAYSAFTEGDYSKVEDILYARKNDIDEVLKSAENYSAEIENAFNTALQDFVYDLRLAVGSKNQNEIDNIFQQMGETVLLGLQAGAKPENIITGEIAEAVQSIIDGGFDLSELAKWAKDSGIEISQIFGENWETVIQGQVDSGFDISELAKWVSDSGVGISQIFGKKWKSVIQSQIDSGFGVAELLLWAEDSGKNVSSFFTDDFKKNFESQLNLGFNTDGIFNWAIQNGKALGDLLGENLASTANQYLYATNDLIQNSINSPGDARMYQQGIYSLGKYATGGYISSGNSAIVGEAGAELISVINGGVSVTPLNSNGSEPGLQAVNNYYNSYSFGDVKLASDGDIRAVAELLADQQRRIELGRGYK